MRGMSACVPVGVEPGVVVVLPGAAATAPALAPVIRTNGGSDGRHARPSDCEALAQLRQGLPLPSALFGEDGENPTYQGGNQVCHPVNTVVPPGGAGCTTVGALNVHGGMHRRLSGRRQRDIPSPRQAGRLQADVSVRLLVPSRDGQ